MTVVLGHVRALNLVGTNPKHPDVVQVDDDDTAAVRTLTRPGSKPSTVDPQVDARTDLRSRNLVTVGGHASKRHVDVTSQCDWNSRRDLRCPEWTPCPHTLQRALNEMGESTTVDLMASRTTVPSARVPTSRAGGSGGGRTAAELDTASEAPTAKAVLLPAPHPGGQNHGQSDAARRGADSRAAAVVGDAGVLAGHSQSDDQGGGHRPQQDLVPAPNRPDNPSPRGAKLASDPATFVAEAVGEESTSAVAKHFQREFDDAKFGRFTTFMVWANDRLGREQDAGSWATLPRDCPTELDAADAVSQMEETECAVKRLFKLAHEMAVGSSTSTVVVSAAESRRTARLANDGKMVEDTTSVCVVWNWIFVEFTTIFHSNWDDVPCKTSSDWAVFGLRLLPAGRPQDPSLMHFDLREVVGGDSLLTATRFVFRPRPPKDVLLSQANERERKRSERQFDELSSEICVDRPTTRRGRVDFFVQPHHFLRRRRKSRQVAHEHLRFFSNGAAVAKNWAPLFVFVAGTSTKPCQRSTLSSRTLALLREARAIPMDSPLKAEHIRHTALTLVHAVLPEKFEETTANARHAVETATNTHVRRVDKRSREHVAATFNSDKVPATAVDLLTC